MGQYHLVVNPDKKQFLNPRKFGKGLKLMEFSGARESIAQATLILLSQSNGQGGGDLPTENLTPDEKAMIGSWVGDRVIVAGDYGEDGRYTLDAELNLYEEARNTYKDISDKMILVLAKGDSPYHSLACLDLGEDGSFRSLSFEDPPANPIAGMDCYNRFKKAHPDYDG